MDLANLNVPGGSVCIEVCWLRHIRNEFLMMKRFCLIKLGMQRGLGLAAISQKVNGRDKINPLTAALT